MKFKRQFLFFLILALFFSIPPFSAMGQVTTNHWAKDLLNHWEAKGLLPVAPDSSISPDKQITRGEFISIINNTFNFPGKRFDWFSDVPDNAWYRGDVAVAAAAGYITGYKNAQGEYEVRAEQRISRQEAAAILSRVFNFQDGDIQVVQNFADWKSIGEYATRNIAYLVQAGYISGYPNHTIRPLSNVTLAEAVKMVDSIAGEIINAKGTYQGNFEGNLLVNTSEVTLNNVVVKGDLYLTQGIGSGNIRLDHVDVAGNTYVYGSGTDNIQIQDSNVQDRLIVLNMQPALEDNTVESKISSFSINGYAAKMTDGTNNITVLVNKDQDMNNLQVNFATTGTGSKVMLGAKELKNGGKYTLNSVQDLVLSSKNDEQKQYRLAIFTVDRVVDTGLPTLVINTVDNAPVVDKVNKIDASMAIIDGSTVQYSEGLHHGALTIKGRGNSSWWVEKKAYKLSTETDAQLLDMPQEEDWVLVPNYSDKTLMRNYIAYQLGISMNMAFSPKMRFVEFYLNGEFLGNYLLGEKIGISKNRVDINKLKNTDNDGSAVTGGYLIEKNWLDRLDPDEIYFQTDRVKDNDVFNVKGPKPTKITTEQMAYISDYFQQAEDALYSDNFKDPVNGYQKYYDVDSLIDWFIVNELFKNVDASFGTSCFLYKDKDGKIHFGPIWDFDLGAGNVDYGGDNPIGFHVKNGLWIARFFEDPAVVQRLQTRWAEINKELIPSMFTWIDETEKLLEPSATENFHKWEILGKEVWPKVKGFETRTTYKSEVDYLIQWLHDRIDWLNETIPTMNS